MPGQKSVVNSDYITPVVSYRRDIIHDDISPPGADIPRITIPSSVPDCMIGASNRFFFYVRVSGPSSPSESSPAAEGLSAKLWIFHDGIAYEATPSDWQTFDGSILLTADMLPVGIYALTIHGYIPDNVSVRVDEQHTE